MTPGIEGAVQSADLQVTAEATRKRKKTFIHYYAKCTQFLAGPLFWIPFHLMYRADIRGRENLRDVQAPVVVIANHIRFFDSFFFRFAFSGFPNLWPLRFMAVRKFLSGHLNFLNTIGIVPLVYGLFAVFLIKKGGDKEPGKNLEKAQSILQNGENVMIYPEGKINNTETIQPFRRGAAVLAQSNGVPVLPVSFHIVDRHLFRKPLTINIGKPIVLPQGNSVEQNTALLQKEIEALYQTR